jgi:membrane-associated phospholipid phosphatase
MHDEKDDSTADDALDRFADIGRFVLVAGAVAAPVALRRDFRAGFNTLTGIISVYAATKAIKAVWKEPRPDGENNKSFPSEHSAECFAAAVSLERDLGGAIGPAALVLATAVALSRVASGKHHVADVIAGAGLGITAANIVLPPAGS